MLNKQDVIESIQLCLKERLAVSNKAALQAYEQATNEESVAENKYDTFGLEASYLAHGQSKRVIECENDLAVFVKRKSQYQVVRPVVAEGCLVKLIDQTNQMQYFFISPVAGGMKVTLKRETITLISITSPLGKCLLGKEEGDDVVLNSAQAMKTYEIEDCM
jgi:transcription elongation GreA/GreB family factor